jgi:hypothetical protein
MGSEPDLDSGALLCSHVVYIVLPQQAGHNEAMSGCGTSGDLPRHVCHVGAHRLAANSRWGHDRDEHQGAGPTGRALFMSLDIVHTVMDIALSGSARDLCEGVVVDHR